MLLCTLQGLPAAFHGRLSEWRFSVSKVSFDIKRLDLLDQAPTLAPLMSQLQNLQAPGAVVELHGHEWTNEALQAVRAGLTTLPHLQFSLRLGVLGDSVLHELLACGESLVSVSVVGCRLQTDEHASVEWRWGELCVRHISTSEMLRLPLPRARDGVAPVLKCSSFQVDRITDQVSRIGFLYCMDAMSCVCVYVCSCIRLWICMSCIGLTFCHTMSCVCHACIVKARVQHISGCGGRCIILCVICRAEKEGAKTTRTKLSFLSCPGLTETVLQHSNLC